MVGLIEEIQRDALDSKVPIEALLRRVKLAAAKLKLDTLEGWVESELNGYPNNFPDYRKIRGQPAAWNPYNGWIPIHSSDAALMDVVSEARIGQSIASLRDLLESSQSSGTLHFPLPAAAVAALNKIMDFQTPRIVVQLSRGHVVGILDHVRNMVLDWAIEMERQDIVGDGMSFSVHEQEEARHVMANFTVGSIGSFVGNMGSGNTSGDINASSISAPQVLEVTNKIKAAIPELERAGVDARTLTQTIEAIEAEVANPNPSRLRGLLTDARNVLVGAAGNLTADGAIAGIAGLLKLLGGS